MRKNITHCGVSAELVFLFINSKIRLLILNRKDHQISFRMQHRKAYDSTKPQ